MLRTVLSLLVTVWLATTITFVLLRVLPGDAVSTRLAQSSISQQRLDQIRQELQLNAPLHQQYSRYMTGLIRGDMGYSLIQARPVATMISERLRPTLTLAISAVVLAAIVGVSLGITAGLDLIGAGIARLLMSLALSTPIYWTGTLALIIVGVVLGLSTSGLLLPTLVLAFHTMGEIARITQANVQQTAKAMFIRTAHSKGLTPLRIRLHHILRVGLLPVITVIALQVGFLLSGTVIVEILFLRPGIGRLLLASVVEQDYPVVQGIVIFSALVYTVANGCANLLYQLADPRLTT